MIRRESDKPLQPLGQLVDFMPGHVDQGLQGAGGVTPVVRLQPADVARRGQAVDVSLATEARPGRSD